MRARTFSSTRPSANAIPAPSATIPRATNAPASFAGLRKKHRPNISQLISNKHPVGAPVPARSLRLDAGELHHLGPFLGFRRHQFAEIGGRAEERHRAEVGEALLEGGIGEARLDFAVELLDDRY